MINLEEKQFYVLLNFFYSQFFCEGLEKAIEDEEVSVVTIFRGMEYFLKLVKEHNIDFSYTTIKEYITETYDNGEEIYLRLRERYEEEICYYSQKEKSFEDMFGKFEKKDKTRNRNVDSYMNRAVLIKSWMSYYWI